MPSIDELQTLLGRIIQRILKLLMRTGYLIEEQGTSYLAQAESDRALTPLQAAACTYRILKLASIRLSPGADDPAQPAFAQAAKLRRYWALEADERPRKSPVILDS